MEQSIVMMMDSWGCMVVLYDMYRTRLSLSVCVCVLYQADFLSVLYIKNHNYIVHIQRITREYRERAQGAEATVPGQAMQR